MAGLLTMLFYTLLFGVVMCGSYAIYRCIQQNIRRAQEAQMQATQLAMANGSVHMQVIGADANPEDANMDAIGVPAAGVKQAGPEEEAFQMPEIIEVTMIRIENPDGSVNLATWDESRARVEP